MFDRIKYFFINNKKPLLIIAAVLIIVMIVFFSIPRKPKEEAPAPVAQVPGQEIALAPTIQKTELTNEDKAKAGINIIGKNFTEIYGTYSNQSNYSNIESILPLISSRYRMQMSQILADSRSSYKPGEKYEGVTTVAVSSPIFEDFDEAKESVVILLKTQRKFSTDSQANYTIKYQDIRLMVIKERDNWLVDDAKWIQ